jgi:hypothetical protein
LRVAGTTKADCTRAGTFGFGAAASGLRARLGGGFWTGEADGALSIPDAAAGIGARGGAGSVDIDADSAIMAAGRGSSLGLAGAEKGR